MTQDTTPSHILLATTGASPQIVTETLYAIHHEGRRWPDEIQLITTSFGKTKAEKGLLKDGHLERLCGEIGRKMPTFTAAHIKVVPDANGEDVEDARSLEDHAALADFIMTKVRNLTATDCTLHASLAGGRKTMTFYLGYAMSLFGRREDLLSHVLISEAFEGNPGFWFPTDSQEYRYLQDRQGERLDAHTASVTLAPIPFIRHRQELPVHLHRQVLRGKEETVKFEQLVELVNLGEQPNNLLLTLDLPKGQVLVKDKAGIIKVAITPTKLDLAFYAMVARATLAEESDLTRPQKGEQSKGLTRVYLNELLPLYGLSPTGDIAEDLKVLEKTQEGSPVRKDTRESLKIGMKDSWFDQRRNSLQETFAECLPPAVCQHLLPEILWSEEGNRLSDRPSPEEERNRRSEQKKQQKELQTGKRRKVDVPEQEKENFRKPCGGYGIPLQTDNITLMDA